MQLNHSRLAAFAHIRAQASGTAVVFHVGNKDRLAANHTATCPKNHRKDKGGRRSQEPCQRLIAGDRARIGRPHLNRRRLAWIEQGKTKGIGSIKERQEDTWQNRGLEQCANGKNGRLAQIGQRIGTARHLGTGFLARSIEVTHQCAQKNNHDRGRDNLAQSARGRNHTRCQFGRVVVAQHCWQRQEAHGHHSRPNDPRGGRKERTHNHDGHRQATGQRAKDARHSCQQVIGDLRPLKRDPHQNKHQNSQKRFDRLTRDHTFVHAVHDEGNVAIHSHFPPAGEEMFLKPRQFGVSEDRDSFARNPTVN